VTIERCACSGNRTTTTISSNTISNSDDQHKGTQSRARAGVSAEIAGFHIKDTPAAAPSAKESRLAQRTQRKSPAA
jgi:hypothetical protein